MRSIKSKITAMMMVASAGGVFIGALCLAALWQVGTLQQRGEALSHLSLSTERINTLVTAVVMDSRGIYMAKSPADVEKYGRPNEARFKVLAASVAEMGNKVDPSDRARFRKLEAAVADFIKFRTETIRLAREVSVAAADAQGNNDQNRANRQALNDLLASYSTDFEQQGDAFAADAARMASITSIALPLMFLAILAITFLAALRFTTRGIVQPLHETTAAMEQLATGNTQATIPHQDRTDEIGTMARTLEVFRKNTEQVRALEAQEKAAAAERASRAEAMVAVVNDVGEVVSAAAAGDFSARLEVVTADREMLKLVEGINEINAVVDSATTEFAEALGASPMATSPGRRDGTTGAASPS